MVNASVKELEDVQRVLARESELEAMLVALMAAPLAPIRTSLEEMSVAISSQREQVSEARRVLSMAVDDAQEEQKKAVARAIDNLQEEIEKKMNRTVQHVAALSPKLEQIGLGLAAVGPRLDDCESCIRDELATLKLEFHVVRRRATHLALAAGGMIVLSLTIAIWVLFNLR